MSHGREVITAERAAEVAEIYERARNTPALDLLNEIYADDVVVHDCSAPEDLSGLEDLKAFYRESHEGFPDLEIQMDDVFSAEDRVVLVWTIHATHTGDLRGLPATGHRVQFSGVAIDRLENDRIVEEWVYFNVLDLVQQLGMELAPAPD